MAHDLVTELLQYSSLACFMSIWQLCANLLIPNCLRSNLSYSPLAALELYVNIVFSMKSGLYYTFRGYSVNNGGTYSNGDATWIENVSQTRHFLQVPILAKFSIHSNNSTKFFFEIGPYVGYCIKNHIDSNPYYLTMPSSGWVEGYPGVGESAEGGSNQFLYQHARNFDWGMTSAVGLENRRWTVKLQYEMSLGKESKNDNIGVNYNSLTLSVGYKLNVKQ